MVMTGPCRNHGLFRESLKGLIKIVENFFSTIYIDGGRVPHRWLWICPCNKGWEHLDEECKKNQNLPGSFCYSATAELDSHNNLNNYGISAKQNKENDKVTGDLAIFADRIRRLPLL